MYPNSSDNPSARGQELVPVQPVVLEGVIVEPGSFPFKAENIVYSAQDVQGFWDAVVQTRRDRNTVISMVVADFKDAFKPIFDEAATAFRKFGEAARDAGLIDEAPPTDPRARALWMKQHRNHGPEKPKNWRKR